MKKIIQNINIKQIKKNIKNINIKQIKKNIKNINIKQINNILFYMLLGVFFVGLVFFINFLISINSLYTKIQENTKKIELINNDYLIKNISENNLRDINTISLSYFIMLNNKIPSVEEINDVKYNISNVLLYAMSNNEKYNISLKDIKDKKHFVSESNIFKKYINSFPNISKYKSKFSSEIEDFNILSAIINDLHIYEISFILNKIKKESKKYEDIYSKTREPFENFIKHIYFPEKGIWKNKFSGKINVDIFGTNYLNTASYIDANLIRYWSEYFSKAYRGKLYQGDENIINSIKIGGFEDYKETGLSVLPININFGVINDNSFYGLISKLTSTNIKNTMNIYKFTYFLWNNIIYNVNIILDNDIDILSKNKIGEKYINSIIYKCIFDNKYKELGCDELFACKNPSNCGKEDFIGITKEDLFGEGGFKHTFNVIYNKIKFNNNYDIKNSFFYSYYKQEYYTLNNFNKLIGANLYNCIFNKNGYCQNIFGSDDIVIKKTIVDFIGDIANCDAINLSTKCKILFVNKFDTNYFIGHTLVGGLNRYKNYSIRDRLKDVYKNISGFVRLGSFYFRKIENISSINNVKYNSDIKLNIFYENITNDYVNYILNYIGKQKCSNITNGKKWDINLVYNFIDKKISDLYKVSDKNLIIKTMVDLNVLKGIINKIKKELQLANNLDKVLLNIQIYRIMKEYGYCAN